MGGGARRLEEDCPSWCRERSVDSGHDSVDESDWHEGDPLMFAAIVPETVRRRAHEPSPGEEERWAEGRAEEFGIVLTRRRGGDSTWVVIASEHQWIELSLESALRLSRVLHAELREVRPME